MIEREKVIKGVESCLKMGRNGYENCDELNCPYFEKGVRLTCWLDVLDDALVLLKDQEAVEPILKREGRNKYYNDYVCPRCDNVVVYEQNYCSECGIPFMWEGR